MHIRLIAVGKVRERYVGAACEDFLRRIRPYYPLEVLEVRPSASSRGDAAAADEALRILGLIGDDDRVWLLDRTGDQLSSEDFSSRLNAQARHGTRRLVFVIGGARGVDPVLAARANFVWSLSALTFLHEWARMIVLEQIYRAAKISRNEPYHR